MSAQAASLSAAPAQAAVSGSGSGGSAAQSPAPSATALAPPSDPSRPSSAGSQRTASSRRRKGKGNGNGNGNGNASAADGEKKDQPASASASSSQTPTPTPKPAQTSAAAPAPNAGKTGKGKGGGAKEGGGQSQSGNVGKPGAAKGSGAGKGAAGGEVRGVKTPPDAEQGKQGKGGSGNGAKAGSGGGGQGKKGANGGGGKAKDESALAPAAAPGAGISTTTSSNKTSRSASQKNNSNKRPQPVPLAIPIPGTQPRSTSTASAVSAISATSTETPAVPIALAAPSAAASASASAPNVPTTSTLPSSTSVEGGAAPPVRSLRASISHSRNALDAAREAALEKSHAVGEKNVDNALSSLQKMISDLKLMPPAPNANASASSTGSSPVGSRSASGREIRESSRSPLQSQPVAIPGSGSGAGPAPGAPGKSPSTSSAKLKADAPTFTPSFASASATSPHSVSPSVSLGPGAAYGGPAQDRSASMSSERRASVSSIGTLNPYATYTGPYGQHHSQGYNTSPNATPNPISPFSLGNLPGFQQFPGVPEYMGELPSLSYNEQYQNILVAQRVQYQQIQLLQAQIAANQMAAQQAQAQAQHSGSFTAPRFRALAEQRQAQQAQAQIAQLAQAQQVFEMQQQALMSVQEAHAKAAARAALKNPNPVFEEDDEPERAPAPANRAQLNPGFTFGAKRQASGSTSVAADDRERERQSLSPPQGYGSAQPVVVDRQHGIGGAQATGLAGLAARAHKRTGSELTPAMQQQLEIQSQIEALQAKQKALMEEELGSQGGSALSQLSNIVKSPPAPAPPAAVAPASAPSQGAGAGHRRVQSSFPTASEPRTHMPSASISLLEQTRPRAGAGEMPPPPVPSTTHNRRHSVNVFAKGAGVGSGFSNADIPEDDVPAPSHRRTGSRSGFESGNWRSISSAREVGIGIGGGAGGGVTDLASAQAQLASLAQFRAAAGGGHNRMASFALPNMLPNLLAATTLSSPGGTSLFQQQQAFQLQLQQNSAGPQRKSLFAPYLPQASLPPLLQAGKLVVGILRVNKKNRSDAYVATDVLEADIYICGSKDRNRALEGDIVAVELLDVDEVWNTKKDKEEKKRKKEENSVYDLKPAMRKQLEKKKDDVEVEGQGLLLAEEEEVNDETKPTYAAHVVAVVERMPGQLFSGQLGVLRPSSAATKEKQEAERRERGDDRRRGDDGASGAGAGSGAAPQQDRPKIVWFKPTDKRVPLIAIPTEQAPVDFIEDPEKWADRLFVATIKRWPITSLHPFGTLVEELGPIGDVEVETSALLKDCNFPTEEFGEQAVKCLPPLPWSIPEREYEIRKDLRNERIFTIDPASAKDLDDAVSISKNEDGSVRLGVHIADVAYFVKPNTALDREARKRATSVYLVQRAVPMLPPQLSERLCSLIPDVERLAFSAFFDVDAEGEVLGRSFARSIIKSCAKLSYADAQGVMDGSKLDGGRVSNAQNVVDVEEDLRALRDITRKLRTKRIEAGAMTSDNKLKVAFELDERGVPVDVGQVARGESNRVVEELMLLANTAVAHVIAHGLPEQALLRRHEAPIERRIEGFVRRAQQMGFDLDASSAGALQRSFEQVQDAEAAMCLELLKKKSMTSAKYFCTGMLDIGKYSHWALNAPLYAHFTSPIRRYADVLVHRMLDSCLTAPNPDDVKFLMDRDQVAKVSQQCNMKKASARLAEEQSIHLHLCMLIHDLTEKYGPVVREGKVTGVLDAAFDVVIPEFAIEKRVHVDKLPLDNAVFDEHKNVLSLYWTKKDVLSFLAETTDDASLASLRIRASATATAEASTGEENDARASSKQYALSRSDARPTFVNTRETGDGHRIQEVKELMRVPVVVVADVKKSPPVLMVYGVNPFA